MIGTTPVGNAYEFLGAAFGWLCPRPISLLTQQSRPLSVLLNARRCECLWSDPTLLLFTEERFSKLPEDTSLFAGISTSSRTMGFFPLFPIVGCLLAILCVSFAKIVLFFYLGSQTIVFTLQVLNMILQFPHPPCLLLLLLLHVLLPIKELVF